MGTDTAGIIGGFSFLWWHKQEGREEKRLAGPSPPGFCQELHLPQSAWHQFAAPQKSTVLPIPRVCGQPGKGGWDMGWGESLSRRAATEWLVG